MSNSARANLPLLIPNQRSKELTHNEALTMLEGITVGAVSAMNVPTPPGSPAEGLTVVVGANPTNVFVGHTNAIAHFYNNSWKFYSPQRGWYVRSIQNNYIAYVFDGTNWIIAPGGSGSGGTIAVLNEGTSLTNAASSLNFAGSGVAATNSNGAITVTIPGSTPVQNASTTQPGIVQLAGDFSGTATDPRIALTAKNIAQWNASKIQSSAVSDISPIDGQALIWDEANSFYRPRNLGESKAKEPKTIYDLLLSFWKFEEFTDLRADGIGGNSLTPNSNINVVQAPGILNKGVRIRPGGYLSASNSTLSIGVGQNFTLGGWLFLESLTNGTVVAKNLEYALRIENAKFSWTVYDSNGTGYTATSATVSEINSWYYILIEYNADLLQVSIQLNNSSDLQTATAATPRTTTNRFYFGSYDGIAANTTSDFVVDSWGAWRRLLTGIEKSYLYNDSESSEIPQTINATALLGNNFSLNAPTQDSVLIWDGNRRNYRFGGVPNVFNTPAPDSPYFLLHFEGTNGSKIFNDSSGFARIPELVGNPVISTNSFKFGNSSGYFDGSSYLAYKKYVWVPTSIDFAINLFINFESINGTPHIFQFWNDFNNLFKVFIQDEKVVVQRNANILITGTTSLIANQWYHIGVHRFASDLRLFVNGVRDGTHTGVVTLPGGTPQLDIGSSGLLGGNPEDFLRGYTEEFRVLRGSGGESEDFTPPTAAYPNASFVPINLNNNARTNVQINGQTIAARRNLNFIPSDNIIINAADDLPNEKVDITISSISTGTSDGTAFNEAVDDRVNALLREGENISLVYDDVANSLTISAVGSSSNPASAIAVLDEGATLTTSATSLNFVGSGVTATNTNGAVSINIPSSNVGVERGRDSVAYTTGVIAANAIENGFVSLGKSFHLLRVESNSPAWIRVYATNAYRAADSRTDSSVAASSSIKPGIIFEGITSNSQLFIDCRKGFGSSLEPIPSSDIPITIANLGNSITSISVTFNKLTIET